VFLRASHHYDRPASAAFGLAVLAALCRFSCAFAVAHATPAPEYRPVKSADLALVELELRDLGRQ